jgi:hypothetical protein
MRKIILPLVLLAAAFGGAFSSPALAQRVFVSAQGSDGNPCSFALPCRTFQHAHDTVAAGGEIDVLDPAGYGMLTITKAVSIQGHGFAGISVPFNAIGITINADAGDAIGLNGLIIDGGGNGQLAIRFNSGKSLVITNSVARKLSGGVLLYSTATTTEALSVSNSYFTQISGPAFQLLGRSSGAVVGHFDRVGIYQSNTGLVLDGGLGTGVHNVTLTDCDIIGPGLTGMWLLTDTSHAATTVMLTRTTLAHLDLAIDVNGFDGANATVRLAQSTITANNVGYKAAGGGLILSYGDNYIDNNVSYDGNLGSIALK